MLSWLVDVVNMYQIIDPMTITFPDDFDPDIRLAKTKFITLVNLLKNEGDEERLASILRVRLYPYCILALNNDLGL